MSRALVKGRVALYLLCRELDAEACRERLTQITALSGTWALALQPSEAGAGSASKSCPDREL